MWLNKVSEYTFHDCKRYKVIKSISKRMAYKKKESEEFLDEPSENSDESGEFLDDEFEEEVDSEKAWFEKYFDFKKMTIT